MKFLLTTSLILIGSVSAMSVQASSGGCARCDDIRAYNAANPHNFEYYEDYLKTQPGAQSASNPSEKAALAPVAKRPTAPATLRNANKTPNQQPTDQ